MGRELEGRGVRDQKTFIVCVVVGGGGLTKRGKTHTNNVSKGYQIILPMIGQIIELIAKMLLEV